ALRTGRAHRVSDNRILGHRLAEVHAGLAQLERERRTGMTLHRLNVAQPVDGVAAQFLGSGCDDGSEPARTHRTEMDGLPRLRVRRQMLGRELTNADRHLLRTAGSLIAIVV